MMQPFVRFHDSAGKREKDSAFCYLKQQRMLTEPKLLTRFGDKKLPFGDKNVPFNLVHLFVYSAFRHNPKSGFARVRQG